MNITIEIDKHEVKTEVVGLEGYVSTREITIRGRSNTKVTVGERP